MDHHIEQIYSSQKSYFNSKETLSVAYRIDMLKKLVEAITRWEDRIIDALHQDLGKSASEAYITEVEFSKVAISRTIKKLPQWSKSERISTPVMMMPGRSKIVRNPYGTVLIIGPWNYPFQLIILPLLGAIAGGNTVVIKPSEIASTTAAVIDGMLSEVFDEKYIAVIQGGVETTTQLLEQKWDHIFFTGSTYVGRIVYQAAAKHLTPVVLELGGKCPVIIDKDIDVRTSARRIIWGKYMNCGQTCLAPDYLLVHKDVQDELVSELKKEFEKMYSENPETSEDYGRIINVKNFDRLVSMIDNDKVVYGGQRDREKKFLGPVFMEGVDLEDAAMQEEIFGPILPILTMKTMDQSFDVIATLPKPLATYVFTNNDKIVDRVLESTYSGGVSVNDILLHCNNRSLPFGGVGDSGIGAYHGRHSYETFTHAKAVYRNTLRIDPSVRYPPYAPKIGSLRKILRWFS